MVSVFLFRILCGHDCRCQGRPEGWLAESPLELDYKYCRHPMQGAGNCYSVVVCTHPYPEPLLSSLSHSPLQELGTEPRSLMLDKQPTPEVLETGLTM